MGTVVIYSGGLDSTVLLEDVRRHGDEVLALSFNYNQRHAKELDAARAYCFLKDIPWRLVILDGLKLESSSQTNRRIDVPEGHYEDASMKITVVPNRNMMMLSIAAAIAIDKGWDGVAYGAHSGDHAIYPDCRKRFVDLFNMALFEGNANPPEVVAPFIEMTKAEIVKLGHELHVEFNYTWSCYKGGAYHCGKCGTCVERREAFILAGVHDPTRYED